MIIRFHPYAIGRLASNHFQHKITKDQTLEILVFSNNYDPDEALRVAEVSVRFENHTYKFNVHNTEGQFTLMLIQHTSPGERPYEVVMCKHAGEDNTHFEPCAAVSKNIKDAARRSIAEHRAKFHFLNEVK